MSLLKTGKADPDDVIIQQCRYQAMLDEYRKFSKAMGLPTQAERFYNGRTVGRIAPSPSQMARYTPEMLKNATSDSKMYYRRKDVLGDRMVSLAAFRQMKYNDVKKFEAIERQYTTVKAINAKPWTRSFKKSARDAYYEFLDGGIELNAHSVSRYLDRRRRVDDYDLAAVKAQLAKGANYKQDDDCDVFYYDGVAIIQNRGDRVIRTIVVREEPSAKWEKK